jgi:CubicO group peptidase (beta-lactamase class C family)
MKSFRITGASVSIVNGDNPVYVRHFGFADRRRNIPVEGSTLFRIGSITKVFTASAVMQLAEQGKIDIDKPIRDYIPEFSVKTRFPDAKPITVRSILCHHAGLPCDNLSGYFTEDFEAFHSVIPFLRDSYAVCPPGRMFYYSNPGYESLGVLVARISGMRFHDYIDNVLLRGLGMSGSSIALTGERKLALSKPYRLGREQTEEMMKGIPEGGIHSTAADMALFMAAVMNRGKRLFTNAATLDAMLTPQYPGNAIDMSFVSGLGWFIGRPGLDDAGKVIWHDGGTPNFFSLVVCVPEHNLGITLLTNSATGAMMNHTLSVEILQPLLKESRGKSPPSSSGREPVDLSPDARRLSTGRFFTLSGIAVVFGSGGHLVAKLPSGSFRLLPHRDGWFGVLLMLFGFIPLKLKKLSMLRVGILDINGEKVFALEQLGFKGPQGMHFRPLAVPDSWKQRTGRYVCLSEKNPRLKSFELRHSRDGLSLLMKADKMGRVNLFLDVVNDSEAVTVGYGRFAGETVIASRDTVTVFGLEFTKAK